MSSAANIRGTSIVLLLICAWVAGVAGGTGPADTLAVRIRQALARYAGPGVENTIEVRGIPPDVHLPAATFDVRVSVPDRSRLQGSVRCEAEILVGGRVASRIPVTVVFRTVGDVLVTERLLDRHATVGTGDVGVQRIETTEYMDPPPAKVSELDGLRLKRIVPAGTILVRSMFERVPLVRCGAEVTILVTAGAVRVKARGVARGDGGKGDRVAVRPAGGRKEISGVVVGDDVVEVAAE